MGVVNEKLESTKRGMIVIDYFYKPIKTIFVLYGNKIFIYINVIYIILIFFLKKKGRLLCLPFLPN